MGMNVSKVKETKAHLESIPLATEKVPEMPQVSAGEG